MSNPELLVVGLDGATFDVLLPLARQGVLPNLASLMERGCWGELMSTIPPFTAAAWSTFITGQNPGRHGVLSFRAERDSFNYDLRGSGFVDARRLDRTLWQMLGTAGKRLGVVNVPLTYPPQALNGYLVTGMLTPPGAQPFTFPPDLVLEPEYLVDVDFVRAKEGFVLGSALSKSEMMAQIRNVTSVRARACHRLLREEPCDVFMVVFTGTDRVMHFLWEDLVSLINPEAQDPERIANAQQGQLSREIEAYFSDLDETIGHLVDQAGPSGLTIVLSDHGFGPAQTRRFFVNVWLESLGLLRRRKSKGFSDLEYWRVLIGRQRRLKAVLRRLLPQETQEKAKSVAESVSGPIVDWSQTRAYCVPIYFHVCGVEINLVGARREGIVQPGPEYEELRESIITAAQQLVDPQSQKPVVELAARREDLFDGPYLEHVPDVILVLDPDYVAASSLAGRSLYEPHTASRPGEHRQEGMFIASGPSIARESGMTGLSLLDVPPTLLHALGLPVPSDLDGRVLEEIFAPEYLEAHPVQIMDVLEDQSSFDVTSSSAPAGLSEEEEESIAQRLKGLGYLD